MTVDEYIEFYRKNGLPQELNRYDEDIIKEWARKGQ